MLFKKVMNSKSRKEELKYVMLQTMSLLYLLDESPYYQLFPSLKEKFIATTNIVLRTHQVDDEYDNKAIATLVAEITENPKFTGNLDAMVGSLTKYLMVMILTGRGCNVSVERIDKEIYHEMMKRMVFNLKNMRRCERGEIDPNFKNQIREYVDSILPESSQ